MALALLPDPAAPGSGSILALPSGGPPRRDLPLGRVTDLVAAVGQWEASVRPRWVLADALAAYPALVAGGARLDRAHDLALTEALLLGAEGRWGEPRSLSAAYARARGGPVDLDVPAARPDDQPALFAVERSPLPDGVDAGAAVAAVYEAQRTRMGRAPARERFAMLVAAESAGALAAVEMTHHGLPWRADIHNRLLTEALGPRPRAGQRPPRLVELTADICAALGDRVNPDSPAEVVAAFARAGISIESTRSWVLRDVDHPAVAPLSAYKDLARLYTANGWAWQERWAPAGRFRPEYVPGGVVSGRWATRGGGGLQIPRRLRPAAVADAGATLVVADAGQLEPRVLAAVSGDPAMVLAAGGADLYAEIARRSFGGDRARAKLGLLGAMYGQTGGQAAGPLATLRHQYPQALQVLEEAARSGERGGLVSSHLGRTCPPGPQGLAADGPAGRARGRFTRNFVIQATAAEWALVWLAGLRHRLTAVSGAELVFFVHDEVVVHTPADRAAEVIVAVTDAAAEAGRWLFGATPVTFPLDVSAVDCYADA